MRIKAFLQKMGKESQPSSLVRQVGLGTMRMMMGGQRMPAFTGITKHEAGASRLYLVRPSLF